MAGQKLTLLGGFNALLVGGLFASGAVPWGDAAFVPFASLYAYAMHRWVFPPAPASKPAGGWRFSLWRPRLFNEYILLAAVLGLLLPVLQVAIAFVALDDGMIAVREVGPHLFLLAAQVLTETLVGQSDGVSLPVKAIVPVVYNTRRLLSLSSWAAAVFSSSRGLGGGGGGGLPWQLFGRAVAVGNLILWHFNLWCFLLPVYVPWCLRTHYSAVLGRLNED